MAEAFFNALADPAKARAVSAGTDRATQVHPQVVAVMAEVGVDLGRVRREIRDGIRVRVVELIAALGWDRKPA